MEQIQERLKKEFIVNYKQKQNKKENKKEKEKGVLMGKE